MRLDSGDATVVVDLEAGGRVASLEISGTEFIVTGSDDPLRWGSYPMVPWAGRTRDGRFTFMGTTHQLPANEPPHAMHGTVFTRPWRMVDAHAIETDLGVEWPFAATATQRFELSPSALKIDMTIRATEPMPAVIGWHPWFRRQLTAGGAGAEVSLDASFMFERGADDTPTGRRVEPPPPPWDDCFGGLARPPSVTWRGEWALTVDSTCPVYVIYTEDPRGVCVEPQTGPPNGLNAEHALVTPQRDLQASMEWRWQRLTTDPPAP